jgi:hypothetical protein
MQQIYQSIIYGVFFTLAMLFWVWFFRRLYLNGWRPLVFVLLAMGWERVKFAFAWLRYSRRRDKLDAFLDEAERTKPKTVSGLVRKPDR